MSEDNYLVICCLDISNIIWNTTLLKRVNLQNDVIGIVFLLDDIFLNLFCSDERE